MAQFKKMQAEMQKAQEELANTIVTGSAAGGAVTVEVSCDQRVKRVTIGKEAVDPDDVETLEDLVAVAVNDALSKASRDFAETNGFGDRRHAHPRVDVTSVASPIAALINELSKLPTIGPKTAARLVFHLLNRPRHEAQSLAEAILAVKDNVRLLFGLLFARGERSVRVSAPTTGATQQ